MGEGGRGETWRCAADVKRAAAVVEPGEQNKTNRRTMKNAGRHTYSVGGI